MKIEICSRADMQKRLAVGLPEDTAVISFYDPEGSDKGYAPVDYSGQPVRLFAVPLRDIDPPSLKKYNMTFSEYFPQVNELAKFILHAVNDECPIICQCDYGQSRSAACAAAIWEHFERKGISVFADDAYLPNQMLFNKLVKALEEEHTFTLFTDVKHTMIGNKYIERAETLCKNGSIDKALTELETLMQKIFADMGADCLHAAYVYDRIADTYCCAEGYFEAVKAYEKAADICISHGQNRAALPIQHKLAKTLCKLNETDKAVLISEASLQFQLNCGDRIYAGFARVIYGDMLFSAHRNNEAILQWENTNHSEKYEIMLKISKAYAALGNEKLSQEYVQRIKNKYEWKDKMLYRLKYEIDTLNAEIGGSK